MAMTAASHPSIAIIGAGVGGLILARALQQRQVPFTIYEGDTSPVVRTQGGSLDLKKKSGQAALARVGLTEAFDKCKRAKDDYFTIVNKVCRAHSQWTYN
jgi:2-polyprenyl-6-methoxyphenol hydroxylase-like FAD-dependent oxidoreductase